MSALGLSNGRLWDAVIKVPSTGRFSVALILIPAGDKRERSLALVRMEETHDFFLIQLYKGEGDG